MAEDAVPVTSLPVRNSLVPTDQILCVSNAASNAGGNLSLISTKNLFGNSSSFTVQQPDPANSTSLTISYGTVFFSNTFGYVAIANNVTRRFAISAF